jgi:hypothetical protein
MSAAARRPRLAARVAVKGVGGLAALDALLFASAGRTDWPAAWILTGLFALFFVTGGSWLVRHDPDRVRARLVPGLW